LNIARWTRYGHDRLYVKDESGGSVGWLDLRSGIATIQQPQLTDAFHNAIARHALKAGVEIPIDRTSPAARPDGGLMGDKVHAARTVPDPERPVWRDLALNRPGEGIRTHAEDLLAGMKSKSKMATFLARALDVKTEERSFRVGAKGEEAVGARLERLSRHGWHVLHSIPVGSRGSDIDHLLIGPGGVFTINTKNHPGGQVWVGEHAIRVNDHPTHYLRNSRYEAQRVSRALREHLGQDLCVQAVLVFLTGTVIPQVRIPPTWPCWTAWTSPARSSACPSGSPSSRSTRSLRSLAAAPRGRSDSCRNHAKVRAT
jgi:hypothetical protein